MFCQSPIKIKRTMRPNSIDGERLCLLYVEFLLLYFLAGRNQEVEKGWEVRIIEGKKKQGQRFSFAPVGCLLFTYVGVAR